MHGGAIIFGGKIERVGKISIDPYPPIENVLFVKGLKYNLLSISQLCEIGLDVSFSKGGCVIQHENGTQIFTAKRKRKLYKINPSELSNQDVTCLLSIKGNPWVWHKKLGHASLRLISKLYRHDLVRGLPRTSYKMIYFVKHVKRGNKLKPLFQAKALFPPQDHLNCYILIYLVQLEQTLSVGRDMVW